MAITSHRKGILLAGGSGSRLYPTTLSVSKQLLPVYDKPLVYYPLTTLMLAGVREILVITTSRDQAAFQRLLGDGGQLGLRLSYAIQVEPRGLPDAFLIAQDFLAGSGAMMILGDNLFYGHGLQGLLEEVSGRQEGATLLTYPVDDPSRYGVVECDSAGQPVGIVEKPAVPCSSLAVTGVYFVDSRASEFAEGLQPSSRGELEITDLMRRYLELGELQVRQLGRGSMWLDAGTETSLLQAANFVETIQVRQGLRICCVEEVAYRLGYISREALERLASRYPNSYGEYLRVVANEG